MEINWLLLLMIASLAFFPLVALLDRQAPPRGSIKGAAAAGVRERRRRRHPHPKPFIGV
jgi:hypothetical protein